MQEFFSPLLTSEKMDLNADQLNLAEAFAKIDKQKSGLKDLKEKVNEFIDLEEASFASGKADPKEPKPKTKKRREGSKVKVETSGAHKVKLREEIEKFLQTITGLTQDQESITTEVVEGIVEEAKKERIEKPERVPKPEMFLLPSTWINFDAVTVPAVTPVNAERSPDDPPIVSDPQSRLPATARLENDPTPPMRIYRVSPVLIIATKIMHNFYESIPKGKLKKYPKNEHFSLPFRMVIASPSGSGKSNTMLYIISLLSKCFTKIVICTKSNETLYDHLKDTINGVDIFESGTVPSMNDYDSETSKLIIFDDLVLEQKKTQAEIAQYFIRGRKLGWSMVYISQSYFGVPKTIRINSQYVVLGRNLTERDLKIICADFPSDRPIKEFITIYKRETSEKMSTLMIDIIERQIYRNVIEHVCEL
ncbi:TPA: hypothetical protein N0F65_004784 [Lagenidium giganteum]|uniref:Uncharacterized protein n=1 Tax=Lagenidium giganteum TaxID=4803 RepID=A0AAV2Z9F6_9STRA|nr:TPA: hypothetical protein N0F65_004784 [Lagenidium giganteum]